VNNVEITVDYLKDKVHEQYLELQELRKSYDELTKSALRLDKMVKEKQEEIDQLKAREEEHQRLNGELREENERLNSIINKTIYSVQEHYDNSYSVDDVNDIGSGTYDDLMEILKGE
jgi:DNA repair exonuclease SbcCD ATPase subunit